MTAAKVTNALIKSIRRSPDPFQTYGDFGRTVGQAFGLSPTVTVSWANKNVLNDVAAALKNDPNIKLDLTFLLRNSRPKAKGGGYPMVIDGRPYIPGNAAQQQRARDVTDQIIAKFNLRARNPY
jgi:hypothetical protein